MSNITQITLAISSIVPTLMTLIRTFAGMIGLYLVGDALFKYYALSNPQAIKTSISGHQVSVIGATTQLIIASLLLSFASGDNIHSIISSMVGMDTFIMPPEMSIINS